MIISLYKYSGKTHVANKIKELSPVYTGDITPYGAFNARTVTFRLSEMYEANLCRYEYNHHAYFGSCTVDVDSNGLYVYSVNIDALTTAWYNGCMHVQNICNYSSAGTRSQFDNRIVCRNYYRYDIRNFDLTPNLREDVVVMSVKRQGVNINATVNSPAFDTYMFALAEFNLFISALNNFSGQGMSAEQMQQKYCPSIFNIFIINKKELNDTIFSTAITAPVYLYPNFGESEDSTAALNIPGIYKASLLRVAGQTPFSDETVYRYIELNYSVANGHLQHSVFKLHVDEAGDFDFRVCDVIGTASAINTIGYKIAYDFVSGRKMVYLVVNDVVHKDIFISSIIPATCVLSFDSSIVRWDRTNAAVIGTALNTAATFIAPNPYTAFGAITSAVQIGQALKDALHERDFGSRGTVGSIGGSPEMMSNYGSYLVIKELVPIDAAGYQALYGYPDGKSRNIATLTGYVETLNSKFVENGIPADIVREAERQSDAGFYII